MCPSRCILSGIFENYHLRVGEITFDSALPSGTSINEQRFDQTETGEAKICTITEISPLGQSKTGPRHEELLELARLKTTTAGLLHHEVFESITNPGKLLILASWRDEQTARSWEPELLAGAGDIRHRHVRVIRDYGMFDRREAPQFYPHIEMPVRE